MLGNSSVGDRVSSQKFMLEHILLVFILLLDTCIIALGVRLRLPTCSLQNQEKGLLPLALTEDPCF